MPVARSIDGGIGGDPNCSVRVGIQILGNDLLVQLSNFVSNADAWADMDVLGADMDSVAISVMCASSDMTSIWPALVFLFTTSIFCFKHSKIQSWQNQMFMYNIYFNISK